MGARSDVSCLKSWLPLMNGPHSTAISGPSFEHSQHEAGQKQGRQDERTRLIQTIFLELFSRDPPFPPNPCLEMLRRRFNERDGKTTAPLWLPLCCDSAGHPTRHRLQGAIRPCRPWSSGHEDILLRLFLWVLSCCNARGCSSQPSITLPGKDVRSWMLSGISIVPY